MRAVPAYTVNEDAVRHAKRLIGARRYVLRSRWQDVQPRAREQNAFLLQHTSSCSTSTERAPHDAAAPRPLAPLKQASGSVPKTCPPNPAVIAPTAAADRLVHVVPGLPGAVELRRALLSCRSFAPRDPASLNIAEFRDPKIDTESRHAAALEAQSPGIAAEEWRKID
jgi:hypothetical protein